MSPHGPGFAGALHSHDAEFPEDDWNLYSMIDLDGLKALNTTLPDEVGSVFRPFVRRVDENPAPLESNCDEEMILIIPFTSPCHIRKLMFIGAGEAEQHPLTIKAYVNKETVDFDSIADLKPAQIFSDLVVNSEGTVETMIPNVRTFTNVSSLVLYITANRGAETTMLRYVGMQGEHTHYRREAVDAEYEVLCTGQDIQQPDDLKAHDNMGS